MEKFILTKGALRGFIAEVTKTERPIHTFLFNTLNGKEILVSDLKEMYEVALNPENVTNGKYIDYYPLFQELDAACEKEFNHPLENYSFETFVNLLGWILENYPRN